MDKQNLMGTLIVVLFFFITPLFMDKNTPDYLIALYVLYDFLICSFIYVLISKLEEKTE